MKFLRIIVCLFFLFVLIIGYVIYQERQSTLASAELNFMEEVNTANLLLTYTKERSLSISDKIPLLEYSEIYSDDNVRVFKKLSKNRHYNCILIFIIETENDTEKIKNFKCFYLNLTTKEVKTMKTSDKATIVPLGDETIWKNLSNSEDLSELAIQLMEINKKSR